MLLVLQWCYIDCCCPLDFRWYVFVSILVQDIISSWWMVPLMMMKHFTSSLIIYFALKSCSSFSIRYFLSFFFIMPKVGILIFIFKASVDLSTDLSASVYLLILLSHMFLTGWISSFHCILCSDYQSLVGFSWKICPHSWVIDELVIDF